MTVEHILLQLKTVKGLLAEVEQDIRSNKFDTSKVKIEDAKYFLERLLENMSNFNEAADKQSV